MKEIKYEKEPRLTYQNYSSEVVDNMRKALKGATAIEKKEITNVFEIIRSLPHGHVAAVLGTLKKIGLGKLIAKEKSRKRDLIIAMIVARIINPASLISDC